MPKKLTSEEFIERMNNKWPDGEYDFSGVVYVNSTTPVKYRCIKHGEREQRPADMLQGKRCKECAHDTIGQRCLKTTEQVIEEFKLKHGTDRYDYSLVEYKGAKVHVSIICKDHGIFRITPDNFKTGYACRDCFLDAARLRYSDTWETFTAKARKKHGDKYDYSKVVYKKSTVKITVICPLHQAFIISPRKHLAGQECPTCSIEKLSQRFMFPKEKFVELARKKHGDKYNYDRTVYKGTKKHISIGCPTHGEVTITAANHLIGGECIFCGGKSYSKVANEWLEYQQVDKRELIQTVLSSEGEFRIPKSLGETSSYKADGYCENTNTIFEFYGDFYHGNPKKFSSECENTLIKKPMGELYDRTMKRRKRILDKGYNMVEIWEDEWNRAKRVIERAKRNWLEKHKLTEDESEKPEEA